MPAQMNCLAKNFLRVCFAVFTATTSGLHKALKTKAVARSVRGCVFMFAGGGDEDH